MGRIFKFLLIVVGLLAIIAVGGYFVLKRDDIPYETLAASYETPASRYVDLPSGVRMHYTDQGESDRPPIVLLHGFSASLQTWDAWTYELGGDFRVITLDLPGHGLTRAPAGYRASIEAFAEVLNEFTDAQGLTSFALAGNSMGGNVAWEYALAHPERVNALVLVDASGWEETRDELAEDPPVFQLMRNRTVSAVLRDLDNTRLFRQGLEASFADDALVTDAMVTRYSELSRAPGHRDILLQMTLGFRARNYATPERLAALRMPVLILHGAADEIIPAGDAQKFHDAIPGSELVVLEGVGHIPQEEAAQQSAATAHAFLTRNIAQAAAAAP